MELNHKQLEMIRAAVKPGDGWGADDWELRLCEEAIAFAGRAERAASNPASPAPVAAITEHDDLSRKVLQAIYQACQRGGSPEQLHAAIMPDLRAALSSAPMAQAERDENVEADAYVYACELMEEGWRERAKRGVEIGTQGSLCDGIGWIFQHMKKLEAAPPAVPAAPSERDADQLNAAIQRAAGELPAGHMIRVEVENGAGWVEWEDNEGFVQFVDSDEGSLAERVIAAIESANAHADSAAAPAAPIERENG